MPPPSDKVRVHIHLFSDDWDKLEVLFGGSIQRSKAVRTIVHDYIKRISARTQRREQPVELTNDDVANLLSRVAIGGDEPGEPG